MNPIEQRLRIALAVEAESWPDPVSVQSRQTSSQRRWLVPVVVVFALASISAAWWVTRDVTDPTAVICYREASLDSDRVGLGSEGSLDVMLCAPEWTSGVLVNEEVAPAGQIPPLVGCVTDQGVLAAFPGDDPGLCRELGLAVPDPGSMTEGDRVRRLTDDLVEHFANQDCQPLDAAEEDVRAILDSGGFEDWAIRRTPGPASRQCASFGIDPPEEAVVLVPIPPG